VGRELIREGVYKTSWEREGYSNDLDFLRTTTVRIGEPDDDAAPTLINVWFAPNETVPLHQHPDWTLLLVLEGQFTTDDGEAYGPGEMRIMRPEVKYSLTAGPEGVRFMEFFETKGAIGAAKFDDPDDPRIPSRRGAKGG
jgi:quercetin dioxygenase-like cupin family protein